MKLMVPDQTHRLLEKFLNESSRRIGFDYAVVDMRRFFRLLNHDRTELGSILSPAELARFDAFAMPKKKLQWLAGRYAVKTALLKDIRFRENFPDLNRIDVLSSENSVPYLLQFPAHRISITHSFPYCIGVVFNGAVGIDLERVIELSGALISQYFHPNEINNLAEYEGTADYHGQAILYWTRKEAVSKLLKLGLKMDFKQIDTASDSIFCKEYCGSRILLKSARLHNYCISLAVEEERLS